MERYTSAKHRGGGAGGLNSNSPLRFKKKDQNDHDRCVPWHVPSFPPSLTSFLPLFFPVFPSVENDS